MAAVAMREAGAVTTREDHQNAPAAAEAGALLDTARRAVDLAEDYLRHSRPGSITAKCDRDMASEADLAVERLLREFLGEQTPHIGFRGEETGVAGAGDQQWVLDPIDGTANFVRGLPLAGVSLALRRDRRPIVGVIGLPWLGQRYWAATGLGAFDTDGPLTAAATTELSEAIVAVGDYGTGPGAAGRNRADHALHRALAPRVQRVRMLGSAALDLVWVAAGRLDASITLGNRAWDMAAGAVIAREAGAALVDHHGSSHDFTSTTTIAVAAPLCAEVTALVRAALIEADYHPGAPG